MSIMKELEKLDKLKPYNLIERLAELSRDVLDNIVNIDLSIKEIMLLYVILEEYSYKQELVNHPNFPEHRQEIDDIKVKLSSVWFMGIIMGEQ